MNESMNFNGNFTRSCSQEVVWGTYFIKYYCYMCFVKQTFMNRHLALGFGSPYFIQMVLNEVKNCLSLVFTIK